jgi:hypothetical protein
MSSLGKRSSSIMLYTGETSLDINEVDIEALFGDVGDAIYDQEMKDFQLNFSLDEIDMEIKETLRSITPIKQDVQQPVVKQEVQPEHVHTEDDDVVEVCKPVVKIEEVRLSNLINKRRRLEDELKKVELAITEQLQQCPNNSVPSIRTSAFLMYW